MINWTAKYIPLKDLKPLEVNPRTITKKEYEKLARDHMLGTFKPLILNADYTILAGNQRYQYYKEKGVAEVWCSVPNRQLKEGEAKEIVLLDNVHRGEFDLDILANEFEETIKELGIDLNFPSPADFEDGFDLPSGERDTALQITYKFSPEQFNYMKANFKDGEELYRYVSGL